MQKIGISACVALTFVFIASAAPVQANIVGNGGFEVAGVGGPTTAAMWHLNAGAGSVAERSSAHPETGGWSAHIYSASPAASTSITQNSVADVGLGSLVPGTSLDISFDAIFNPGPGGVMIYTVRILNGVGGIVADSGFATVAGGSGGVYQTYTRGPLTVPAFGAAPNDVYAAMIEIAVNSAAFAGSTSEAYIDNVQINGTVIPEPASLALLGLAALFIRRR